MQNPMRKFLHQLFRKSRNNESSLIPIQPLRRCFSHVSNTNGSNISETNNNDCADENHYSWETVEKKCSVLWQIPKFKVSWQFRNKSPLKFPFAAANDDFKWSLEYSVYSYECPSVYDYNTDFISLILYPDCDSVLKKHGPVSGKAMFSVLDSKSENIKVGIQEFDFKFESGQEKIQCCGTKKFMELRTAEDWITDNNPSLNVVCDITYTKTDPIVRSTEFLKNCLISDMERQFMNEDTSDVIISVGEKSYFAHKAILSARSPVFDAMLNNDWPKNATNRICMKGMDDETFKEMLYYIYTGKTKTSRELALKLLPAADTYDLKALKAMCTEVLAKSLSKDNAIEVLLLADASNARQLIKHTFEFIKEYITESADFKSEVWKIVTETRPHLMKNMLAVYFSSNKGYPKIL